MPDKNGYVAMQELLNALFLLSYDGICENNE